MNNSRLQLSSSRRAVVKIGTGVLTSPDGGFDRDRFGSLCEELATLAMDRHLVVVSSGAIALGAERLGLRTRPRDIPSKQAAAAVGQSRLMGLYDTAFAAHGRLVAQVLLTHADIQSRTRYLNARHALATLLERGVVPIINENDTVSVEELKFGDNDTLAGMVVDLVGADLLVVLTDTAGVFTADPRVDPSARKLDEISRIDEEVLAMAGGARSRVGTGGMSSKLKAARRAGESGVPTVIAPGKQDGVISSVLRGEPVGTLVHAGAGVASGRKRWIARDLAPRGEVIVDEGACRALVEQGRSLLPSGIEQVRGLFGEGDAVDILSRDGRRVARGLAGYSAEDLRRIAGMKSTDIERVLGYKYLDEAIHRDDLVVLDLAQEFPVVS